MASLSDSLQNLASGAKIGAQKIYGSARKEVINGLKGNGEEEYAIDPEGLTDEEIQEQVARANDIKKRANIAAKAIDIYSKGEQAVAIGEFLLASWPALLAIGLVVFLCGVIVYVSTILPHATPVVSQKLADDPTEAVVYKTICDNAMYTNAGINALPTFDTIDQCFTYLDCAKNTESVGADSSICLKAITATDSATSTTSASSSTSSSGTTSSSSSSSTGPSALELGISQPVIVAACTSRLSDAKKAAYGTTDQCTAKLTCADLEEATGQIYAQCH